MVVDSGESFPQVDWDSVGQACGESQHPALSSRAGQLAGVERCDRCGPVDTGRPLPAGMGTAGGEEVPDEVGPVQPVSCDE